MIKNTISFLHHNKLININFNEVAYRPSITVLNYLRQQPAYRGTKEGCGEGDCGACTVVLAELDEQGGLRYKAVDSCLLFLPALHGKQLITVENLSRQKTSLLQLHPVQQAMVNNHGSQCGYCTPGFVMALFALYKSDKLATRESVQENLVGNLCRCTGYEPIIEAAMQCCANRQADQFSLSENDVKEQLKQILTNQPFAEISTNKQHYFLPSTLTQALDWRASYPEAIVINGATDTAIRQNKTWEFLPQIIDLSHLAELKTIERRNSLTYFGSGVTIEQFSMYAKENLPELLPMLDVFASVQIREVASIGGNLSTASPIGDLIPVMMALKAKLKITGPQGNRWVEMEDFITDYRQNCLQKDELLVGIGIHDLKANTFFRTAKISTRRDLDISTVNIAMRLQLGANEIVEEILLAYGGMAATVKRAGKAEQFLLGKPWTMENVEQAQALIEEDFTPISDARSGAEYRRIAAKNLLLKMYYEVSQ
jgi:xanthine dehydrogenase small subunit